MAEKCKDIMTRNPVCCLKTDSVEHAAELMKQRDIGPLPVVEDNRSKKLVGIVTDRDLAIKVLADRRDPKTTKVGDVMSSNPVACSPEDDLERALNAMEDHQVRRIPVVDSNACIVGIIAQADIATRIEQPEKTAEMVEQVSRPKTRSGSGV
jgi:CBS domain-containing protein